MPSDPTSTIKLEPLNNTLITTIDSENPDSRLIRFKEDFNFDENYQEWSNNVSNLLVVSNINIVT